jgi:aryl-alcohol dehydrogenase-like predicted oxidoreductase
MKLTRRDLMKLGLGATALAAMPRLLAQAAPASSLPLITKAIPSSGERIPVIGIGTRTYNSLTEEIRSVLTEIARSGCTMIDTADNYAGGNSEQVIGQVIAENSTRDDVFFATKINVRGEAAGRQRIDRCFSQLRTDKIDLIYVHNLVDTEVQLGNLREAKAAGRIRYLGVTTSSDNQYGELEQIMRNHDLDFVQLDYAIDNRSAEARLLPLAADRGMAVVTNLPFGRASLFRVVGDRPLPEWASEFNATTWAQFFLKYNVSHPSITAAIPGTTQLRHLLDNVQGARGQLPDAAMRTRMEQFMATL